MKPQQSTIHRLARAALRTRALDFSHPPIALGNSTLLPHQTAAVHWLLARIATHHGALLADPPGLGKTYVALAVATALGHKPLVIAPATLRTRWLEASAETAVALDFISTERLSAPAATRITPPPFVIIDEAHHLRTPSTRRHQRTTALCANARVLLLSATPIHNHPHDLEHITALFHLPATRHSITQLRHLLTLRRTLTQIHAAAPDTPHSHTVPRVRHRATLATRAPASALPSAILALPSLGSDSPDGHTLLQLGILHALRSSDAAARQRIRRRIAITLAIEHAALAHVTPDHALLRAFRTNASDTQLALPQLLGEPATHIDPELPHAAARQRLALEALLPLLTGSADVERSTALRRLARWCARPVVAFTQFAATATALHHLLRNHPGIALLSGTTARIASGVIPRSEVLERLLSPTQRAHHNAVRLLITTDVLSEGLSLSGVGTVVHLDLPWTAARLDQRVGRAARIGAPVSVVDVLQLPAPLPPDTATALHTLLARKRRAMRHISHTPHDDASLIATLRLLCASRSGRRSTARWLTLHSHDVQCATSIAMVSVGRQRLLVAYDDSGLHRPRVADWQALAHSRTAHGTHGTRGHIAALRRALHAWVADRALSRVMRDPRDQRWRDRREADQALMTSDVFRRAQSAHTVSALRGALARSSHPLRDQRPDCTPGEDMWQSTTTPGLSLTEDSRVRVHCGVVMLPHG